ncbi:hypothetical protein SpCBS45565_g02098 [Spizellomyces sp. 'palustris']|nr:hypothetical protein SpCBS45565_g02098 [Spizellomyces sp. 'palustris']
MAHKTTSSFLASDTLSHVAFSSCAAVIARCAAHPLDTIKTRIQFASPITGTSEPSLGQIRSTVRQVLQKESYSALYRGLPVALVFSVPALSVYLGAYDYSKQALGRWGRLGTHESMSVHALASCCAEILSGALWTPMEVLKNKMQVHTGSTASISSGGQTLRLIRGIYQSEGIRGFFKGYFLALAVFVPYTITYFVAYEKMKRQAGLVLHGRRVVDSQSPARQQLPFGAYVVCSGTSGALAGAVSNALDIVKTRVQASRRSQSAMSIIRHMWIHEGKWRAFGRGLLARVLWVTPTVTLSMSVYEVLKDWRIRLLAR